MTSKELLKELKDNAEKELARARTRKRDIANTLVKHATFREWAFEVMNKVGFFGEGRELSAYEQGYRGAIVRIFEDLAETADDGDEFIKAAFNNLKKGTK